MSRREMLSDHWQFCSQKLQAHRIPETPPADGYEAVKIPHDWLIGDAHSFYEDSVGWYRRTIRIDDMTQNYALRFEGVYMDCTVYVNGMEAGCWKYGYTTFELEAAPFFHQGENELLVRVVYECPNSRWYSGAGIYRPVWLITRDQVHFQADGIYLHTQKKAEGYLVTVSSETAGLLPEKNGAYQIRYSIRDTESDSCVCGQTLEAQISGNQVQLLIPHARQWSLETPDCYELRAELTESMGAGQRLCDAETVVFGCRTLEFTTDRGFFLNGKHVKLQGVCMHHDLGCLGSAVNRSALERQLRILRKMGVNAIRTAHNMPAPCLLELTDQMGFLVMDEAFDCWRHPKTTYDYARFFDEWVTRDVCNWIRRDRNHPSVILWSIGNEIHDTHAGAEGADTMRLLMKLVAQHDPLQNARVTFGTNYMPWENTQKCADIIKLTGYNYAEKLYREHHEAHPDWIIYGSETSSTVQSRGIYHFPYRKEILADDDEQCSSLGNSVTSWGAKSTEFCITTERDTEFSLGQFLWSGFDYIGEPTPYHTKNSYFGQIDTAGFPKDSYYLYQAGWTDYHTAPMVHIFPYWDFNEGQLIDVRVCSNAPRVELFLNGKSLGKKNIDLLHGNSYSGDYQIPYRKGVLLARAYDEHGTVIAQDEQRSFSEAVSTLVTMEKEEACADSSYLRKQYKEGQDDLLFASIQMIDAEGRIVENACNEVRVTVTGPGRLIGLDNGDSTDMDSYQSDHRRLFSGKLLAVVERTGAPGSIELQAMPYYEAGIPVRKLELRTETERILRPGSASQVIICMPHPADAMKQPLIWRVTDESGVDATFAEITIDSADQTKAVVCARGDGSFYVRCMCQNGTDHMDLISQIEFRAEGFGRLNLMPYEFLSASLYDRTGGDIGIGNERGISTARDGVSWVAYEHLDFGAFGSSQVTIPIFSFGDTPLTFWEGIPYEEGSRVIGQAMYTIPSIWNTYQADTFQLTCRLKGVTTFAIETDRKIHVKGFQFIREQKGFARLNAGEADALYGDSFLREGSSVLQIGNNVTLVYEHMDFGHEAAQLTISGYTPHEINTIQVRFEREGQTETELIEFQHRQQADEQIFDVRVPEGEWRVSFIFLPGCAFDFEWFCFS